LLGREEDVMKLYSGPLSLFSAKVRIALAEKSLDHELVQVGWSRQARYEPHHPDVVALNPKRQVPVLVDDPVVVYDSTLIFEYLEDRYPTPPLFPGDVAGRARCRQQEAAADEIWFPHLWTLIDARFYPGGAADAPAARAASNALTALFTRFDEALAAGDYYCGAFSVADIGSLIVSNAAAGLGAPIPEACGRMAAWRERMLARPAVRAIVDELGAAAAQALAT
jgi:glutathione S-transferase